MSYLAQDWKSEDDALAAVIRVVELQVTLAQKHPGNYNADTRFTEVPAVYDRWFMFIRDFEDWTKLDMRNHHRFALDTLGAFAASAYGTQALRLEETNAKEDK